VKDHLPVTSQRRVEVPIQSRQLALPGERRLQTQARWLFRVRSVGWRIQVYCK